MSWSAHTGRDRAQRGSTLAEEFQYLRNIPRPVKDIDEEYLRILRRAYVFESEEDPVAKKYRLVIGTIIAAKKSLGIHTMSRLLGITEDAVLGALKPISSIVDLSSSNNAPPNFYHATFKEFITGKPQGNEEDTMFFIDDPKGACLGLPILKLLNNFLNQNVPNQPPLGHPDTWKGFLSKLSEYFPDHVQYAGKHLHSHLDLSKPLPGSQELRAEFKCFCTKNLLSFFAWQSFVEHRPYSHYKKLSAEFNRIEV